ncbi:MAG: dynamin family protein, partial [Actinomycetota bacterium]
MTATVQPPPAADPARAQQGPGGIEQAIMELVPLLQQLGRRDLVDRATAAGARLKRPATIVTVVGEFKQGKSSLVNGLLGHDVCPVDDDLATSVITLVRHGEQAGAVVRRRVDGQPTAEQIPIDDLQNWVSEQGNPENERQVERVELVLPSKILAQGLILVDTPGMGGLGAGHAAATTSFLPYADGLILTSDSSSELSANEIEFMAEAAALCPTVMFAQTKTDLYPEWQRIFDINRQHLANRGLEVPMVAISSQLRLLALERKRRVLNERSHFPELIASLKSQVIEPARANARRRSADDVTAIGGMVRMGLERERELLAEPESVARSLAELQDAKDRLEHLRGPGARWNVIVGDRSSDLQSSTAHHFRAAMRTVSRELEERIEDLSSAQDWDVLSRDLQTMVGDVVTRAFLAIDQGHQAIRGEVVDLLEIEVPTLAVERGHQLSEADVLSLWSGKPIEEEATVKDRFKTGVAGIRGAQGGVMMFGML